MNSSDFEHIEQALGLTLPQAYRQVLISYPFAQDTQIYDRDLFESAAGIIDQNQIYRQGGFFGQKWPAHYLIIGRDTFGNLHFINLNQPDSPVYFADHEDTVYSTMIEAEEAPSIEDWVIEMQEQEEGNQIEYERMVRAAVERRRSKKWWQFWI